MAKQKKKIDYFPFYCEIGKTFKRFNKKFGLEGLGIWIRILMELGNSDDQYIVLNSDLLIEEFEEETGIPKSKLFEIMDWFIHNTPSDFNTDLWLNYRIIRNDKLIQSLDHLYGKRKEKPKSIEKIKESESKIESESKVKEKVIVEYSKVKESAHAEEDSKRNLPIPQHSDAECVSDEISKVFEYNVKISSNLSFINKEEEDKFKELLYKVEVEKDIRLTEIQQKELLNQLRNGSTKEEVVIPTYNTVPTSKFEYSNNFINNFIKEYISNYETDDKTNIVYWYKRNLYNILNDDDFPEFKKLRILISNIPMKERENHPIFIEFKEQYNKSWNQYNKLKNNE